MSLVSDRELVLFHYRDGLEPARLHEIEDVLFFDAELRLRLAALRETLAATAEAWPLSEPDADFEQRIWQRVMPAIGSRAISPSWRRRWLAWIEPLRPAPVAFAGLVLAALAIGFLLGQQRNEHAPAVPATLLAEDASSRVLRAYLAAHLQDTERALLVASHSPGDGESAQQLAADLLESNRLFAVAAERAGKRALGQFLRELEPVLIELSNEDGTVAPALGDEIRQRDLAFKTRAAAAALQRREFATAAQSL